MTFKLSINWEQTPLFVDIILEESAQKTVKNYGAAQRFVTYDKACVGCALV